jgi:hypothetical protein
MSEGDKTISGRTYPMSGWGWSCTCGQAGFGYPDEGDCEEWCQLHIDVDRARHA